MKLILLLLIIDSILVKSYDYHDIYHSRDPITSDSSSNIQPIQILPDYTDETSPSLFNISPNSPPLLKQAYEQVKEIYEHTSDHNLIFQTTKALLTGSDYSGRHWFVATYLGRSWDNWAESPLDLGDKGFVLLGDGREKVNLYVFS